MRLIYPLVAWLYLAIPLIAIIVVARRSLHALIRAATLGSQLTTRNSQRLGPVHVLIRAATLGAFLGGTVALLYRSLGPAPVPIGQIAGAAYLGISAVLVLYGINWLLGRAVSRLFRIDLKTGLGGNAWVQIGAGVLQAGLLVLVGLPYLGSLLVLYRPKVPTAGTPRTLIDAAYETVRFSATDGTRLEGWWIGATSNQRTDGQGLDKQGRDTVLFCHGFGADKASDLFLAADLVANGYNLFAIDLRAHGHSAGQFTGFGGIESRDVLGAIRYLHASHPGQCRRILGFGEGLGAVALIEAAADPGSEGQSISAIAAYNPYDNLDAVLMNIAEQHAIRPAQWAFRHAILPVASAQLGSDLTQFSPALALRALWPRPILVLGDPLSRDPVHGRSFELYQSALQPKYGYWREDMSPADLLHDPTAALTVRIFFDEERSLL